MIGGTANFWQFLSRPNRFQNYPVLSSVNIAEETQVTGTLDSMPQTTFRVEFFVNSLADPSGNGEGETLLGSMDVTTDGNGLADFTITFPIRVPPGHFITATATDPEGNTSEFSNAVEVEAEWLDFGDAADPKFPTLLASNGARHALGSELYLGWEIDADEDGQPSELADGDDVAGTRDEDGVVFLSSLVPGQWAAVEVTASAQGRLDAWIDFGNDGNGRTQKIMYSRVRHCCPVPIRCSSTCRLSALGGTDVFARFRFSSDGGLSFDGPAVDGEVEDYVVAIEAPPTDNRPPTAVDDVATTVVGTSRWPST